MTIRNGRAGDIVYLNHGRGPQAMIVERRDLKRLRKYRGIIYVLTILENKGIYRTGDSTDQRALTLSRDRLVES